MPPTVVIIHPGSLGDVLLAIPAIRLLKAGYPQHEVILCANEPVGRLLLECREIDSWISVQGKDVAGLFDQDGPIEGGLSRSLADCDCAVAWMLDRDGRLAETLKRAGAVKVIASSPFSAEWKARHQSDRFCEILKTLPVPAAESRPMRLSEAVTVRGRVCLERAGITLRVPFIAIHPGSGTAKKSVAIDVMAGMIAGLQREGTQPVVIEGPADQEAVATLLGKCSTSVMVLRDLDLTTLAGVLSHAAQFVGHDSGVTHLAAVLGLQTLVYFGPTDPDRWAPLGGHVSIIQATGNTP